jgi:murein DD-endopeptidase MepM/ murein hydrolase activator NlpD
MLERVGLVEAMGLEPWGKTLREAEIAIRGDGSTPKTRFGLSSLKQFRPRYAVPLWLGRAPEGRRVPLTNLYNYRQPPPELGWSVRVTDVLDFRGGKNTYDSHNGTDFAVPPGTLVLAAAPGEVIRISSEFHRGGRKVFIDHGAGLVTTYNHLARYLVDPGQKVKRGEPIAVSGYSGIDAFVGFPWTPPHVHFNVWLDGVYVDPFAPEDSGEASLWRNHNDPLPTPSVDLDDDELEPTPWSEAAIAAVTEACHHDEARAEILSQPTLAQRAGCALMQLNYFPTRFDRARIGGRGGSPLYGEAHPRAPRLDLPFSSNDYDGVLFCDR